MNVHLRPLIVLLGVAAACVSCKEEPRGGPRVPTYPIRGQVFVDGKPAALVQVVCHPAEGTESKVVTSIGALTDNSGNFEISTYEGGDGAPAGTYKLTFMWGQYSLMTARYGGPDKLKGRYYDAEKSKFVVVVEKGKPADLGRIDLSTKASEQNDEKTGTARKKSKTQSPKNPTSEKQ